MQLGKFENLKIKKQNNQCTVLENKEKMGGIIWENHKKNSWEYF